MSGAARECSCGEGGVTGFVMSCGCCAGDGASEGHDSVSESSWFGGFSVEGIEGVVTVCCEGDDDAVAVPNRSACSSLCSVFTIFLFLLIVKGTVAGLLLLAVCGFDFLLSSRSCSNFGRNCSVSFWMAASLCSYGKPRGLLAVSVQQKARSIELACCATRHGFIVVM